MHTPELTRWLERITVTAKDTTIIMVPGGGEFVETIRDLQASFKFNDSIAHRLALLGMCQFGYLLSGLNPEIRLVDNVAKLATKLDQKVPLLWLPMKLDDITDLPASWDYTSDSIALWLAKRLFATRLVLVKSRAITKRDASINQLINKGALDLGFQKLLSGYSGEIIWFEKSEYQWLRQRLLTQTAGDKFNIRH